LKAELGIASNVPTLLAASIHPGEDEIVVNGWLAARAEAPSLRLVLVPRYGFDVPRALAVLDHRGVPSILRSKLPEEPAGDRVVVVDTFGELSRLYATASIIFVGGSLYRRNVVGFGQNLVEPLVHGVPVLFGPYMTLWSEITESLRKTWPPVEVSDAGGLA